MKSKLVQFLFALIALFLIVGCSSKEPTYKKVDTTEKQKPVVIESEPIKSVEDKKPDYGVSYENVQVGYKEKGFASWYGKELHGEKTASGEIFNMYALTAAHRTFPMGTIIKVTNLQNGKNVVVRINDRGPYDKRRIIDLSYKSALNLGITSVASAEVELEVLGMSKQKNVASSSTATTKTNTVSKTVIKTETKMEPKKVYTPKKTYTPPTKTYTPKKTYTPPKKTVYKPTNKKVKEEIINDDSFDDEQVLDKKTKEQLKALRDSELKKSYKSSGGEYYIQIGSFKNYSGAKSLRKKLQAKHPDHPVLIKEAQVQGSTFHRVVIAGFNSKAEANSYKSAHSLDGYVRR